MNDDSAMQFGPNTTLIFNSGTELRTDLGPIQAGTTVPDVYATTDRAGFVELASKEEIRGAFGNANTGIADKVVVTAAELAAELNVRLDNVVNASGPLSVSANSVEADGGPNDDDDSNNITQFTIQLGLDAGNQNDAKLAGLRLGTVDGQLVTSITNSFDKSGTDAVQKAQLVSARALRLYQIDTDQLVNEAVETAKIKDLAVITSKLDAEAVTEAKIAANAVTTAKINNGAVSTIKIANDAVNEDKIADNAVGNEHLKDNAVDTDEIADSAVETDKIDDYAVTAAKLSGQQSGTAAAFAVRHWATFNASGGLSGDSSGTLTCSDNGDGDYTVSFSSNGPGDGGYCVIATTNDGDGDHTISVLGRNSSSFQIRQFDMQDNRNGGDLDNRTSKSEAPFSVMVIY